MTETSKSLVQDGGFLDLVAVTESLISKQKSNLNSIEEYLMQYGYHPPLENVQKPTLETGLFSYLFVPSVQKLTLFDTTLHIFLKQILLSYPIF